MKQLKYSLNVPILLLLVLGAYAPHAHAKLKGVYQEGVTKEAISIKLEPVTLPPSVEKVVATSLESLKNSPDAMDYIEIGQITIRRLKEACFNGKCEQYVVEDPTDILLTKAKEHGGTNVVFEIDDDVRVPVYRDSDKCEIEGTIGGEATVYEEWGSRKVYKERRWCEAWYEQQGNAIWYEVKATVWRLDKALASKLRELDLKDLTNIMRPVIFEAANSYYCQQDLCCGYKIPAVEATIFEATALACSPFFKSLPHYPEYADKAIVFVADQPPWHVERYGSSVYIINNHGLKTHSCNNYTLRQKPSVNDIDCGENEECLRNLLDAYSCTRIQSY